MKLHNIFLIISIGIFSSGCSFTGYSDTYSCRALVGGSCGSVSQNIEKSIELSEKTKTEKPIWSYNDIRIYMAPYEDMNGILHEESYIGASK